MSDVKDVLELELEPKPGAAVGENPEGSKPPTKGNARRAPAVPKVVPEMPGAGFPLH